MKLLLLGLLAVGVARSPGATPGTVLRQDDPLAAYRWKARVLLVFAPRADAPALAEQRRFLEKEKTGLRERDLVVLELTDGAKAETLRRQFNIRPENFTAILIGKDGGEKLRKSAPVSPKEIFDLIDAMPGSRKCVGSKNLRVSAPLREKSVSQRRRDAEVLVFPKRLPQHLPVVEVGFHAPNFLVGFVALARHEDDVVGLG